MSRDLAGRVALVTGVDRRKGIGTATCQALAQKGADIFFTHWRAYDRATESEADDNHPAELETELRARGVGASSLEVDLSTPDAARQVVDAATTWLGPLAILVNNAAYSMHDGPTALDEAALDAHYAINVRAPILLSVEFTRRHVSNVPGRIINLTSGQSLAPMPEEIAYATSKGAIEAFTSSFAAAVADRGISVNAINPGPTDTGWMTEEIQRELLPRFPAGRIGQAVDVARLVAFLAGDDAGWVTGQVIHSEGGFRRY